MVSIDMTLTHPNLKKFGYPQQALVGLLLALFAIPANANESGNNALTYTVVVTEKGARLLMPAAEIEVVNDKNLRVAPRVPSDNNPFEAPPVRSEKSDTNLVTAEHISWAAESKTSTKSGAAYNNSSEPVKQQSTRTVRRTQVAQETGGAKAETIVESKPLAGGDRPLIDSTLVDEVDKNSRVRTSHVEEAVATIAQKLPGPASGVRTLPDRRYRIPNTRRARRITQNIDDGRRMSKVFPITIEFANVPIELAAQMLSSIIGVDILLGTEVEGSLNLALYDVPWDVAIDTILSVEGLAQYVDERANLIRWHDPKRLEILLGEESKRAEEIARKLRAETADLPQYTEIFQLFYTEPKEVGDQLEDIFSKTETDEGSRSGGGVVASLFNFDKAIDITVNEKQNLIIVKGYDHQLDLVAQLIEKIDAPTKQVMIEAFIVEVSDDFERQLGSRLSLDATAGGNRAAGTLSGVANAGGLSLSDNSGTLYNLSAPGATTAIGALFDSNRLKLELSALEQEGYSKTISNPRLLAFDNEEATIFQGSEVPYSTTSNEGTQTEFKEAGLKLSVTPSVVGDGTLIIDVTVNQDTVEVNRDNPPITKREISTRLLVKDGGAAILGGIFLHSETNSKRSVPLLGDIPVVGRLFSARQNRDDRRELLIFIVPTIL